MRNMGAAKPSQDCSMELLREEADGAAVLEMKGGVRFWSCT
jgi:hypothetical protein